LAPLKAYVKALLDRIVRVCLKRPHLEFFWFGDDAIYTLQPAQALSLLVGVEGRTEHDHFSSAHDGNIQMLPTPLDVRRRRLGMTEDRA
jgi:hypothetical protein